MRLFVRLSGPRHRIMPVSQGPGICLYPVPPLLVPWSPRLVEFAENLLAVLSPSRRAGGAGARPGERPSLGLLPAGAVKARSLAASLASHGGAVSLLVLMAVLAPPPRVRSPEEIARDHAWRISWYTYSDELPKVEPEPGSEPKRGDDAKPLTSKVAEPNLTGQAIVSNPKNPDNNRQTIIQPDSPDVKITSDVRVPNIVLWQQPAAPSRYYLPAPDIRMAERRDPNLPAPAAAVPGREYLPAPDVAMEQRRDLPSQFASSKPGQPSRNYLPAPDFAIEKNGNLAPGMTTGPPAAPSLAYLPSADVAVGGNGASLPSGLAKVDPGQPARAYLPAAEVGGLGGGSAAAATANLPGAQAPERGYLPAADVNVNSGRRLIAVGLDPAPAGGAIVLPPGNRAGAFSTGTGGGSAGGSPAANGGSGKGGASGSGGGDASIRVPGLSISGGTRPPSAGAGAVVSGPRPASPASLPEPPVPPAARKARPDEVAAMIARETRTQLLPVWRPGEQRVPRERHLPKKVYTAYINMPNVTSREGSWLLKFSELNDPRPGEQEVDLTAPIAVRKVDPVYDLEAQRSKVEGMVVLAAVIRSDGRVDSVRVLRGLDMRLDENAIKAFQRWQFRPATRNGVPVDLEATIQIPFIVTAHTK